MSRSASLSSKHYAYHWKIPVDGELNDRFVVNQLAIAYASQPDGPEKEAMCLEIVQCFHGYIMKYLNMIIRGHLPAMKTPAGKDASKMLSTLVPRGKKATRETLSQACRTLHLAFKQNTADDIYDILVMCIMRAIRKYDPHYTGKVRTICEAIDARPGKLILEPDISQAVGFVSLSCIRMLVRRGHLVSVAGAKKKVVGYHRTKNWPPDEAFFNSGPVGFVYFLPMYFRYYLHEYISNAMSSIETKEGMLQLEQRPANFPSAGDFPSNYHDRGIPHVEGELVSSKGGAWAADMSMMSLPLDVSRLTTDWVRKTNDRLFRKLTVKERYLLYLMFVKELKWSEIASCLAVDVTTARKMSEQVLTYLRARATAKSRPV